MAQLTYAGITIEIQKTHTFHHEDVYDDTQSDYLWSKVTIDVTGYVNLAAMAYVAAPGNPNPVRTPGAAPFLTIAAIRDTLALPRQLLTFTDENNVLLLQSPANAPIAKAAFRPGGGIQNNVAAPGVTMDCDCTNGPNPLDLQILEVIGAGKTCLVRFVITTTINDALFWTAQGGLAVLGRAAPKPPVILSNRWTTTETLDPTAFSTRVFSGRVICRADILRDIILTPADGGANRLAIPDDWRNYWANFYAPPGFQRQQVWVQQSPDGNSADYRVVDVQLPVTLTDQRACRLEAMAIYGMSSRGAEATAWDATMATFDLAAHGAELASFDPVKDAGAAVGFGLRTAKLALQTSLNMLPRSWDRFIYTATGQPGSNRQSLVGLLYKMLATDLGAADSFFSGTDAVLEVDRMGKWARLTVDVKRGPLGSSVVAGFGAFVDLRPRIPADDGIPGVTSSAPGTQPVFPSDSNLRGTALEYLVSQSLMYPYTEAPSPGGHSQAGVGVQPP